MAIKVLMPALSPTMSEGVINKWLVSIGDTVSAGDILAEIETDKATMEVEAVDEGKITHLINTTPDKQIAVNSVIALINGNTDEKLEDYNNKDNALSNDEKIEVTIEPQRKTEEDKTQLIEKNTKSNADQNTNFASPFVKKFSKDNNIDLTLIKGSGPNGRIIKNDIQNIELKINDEHITVIEPSSIRKIIAEKTTQTKNEVPHFYLTIETRMDKIINLRKKIKNKNFLFHCWTSILNTSVASHVSLAIQNKSYLEYNIYKNPINNVLNNKSLNFKKGKIYFNKQPGLGITLNSKYEKNIILEY